MCSAHLLDLNSSILAIPCKPADRLPALLFLNTRNGATASAPWPSHVEFSWVNALGSWSPAGQLFARSKGKSVDRAIFTVFDTKGRTIASTIVLGSHTSTGDGYVGAWDPSGSARLLIIGQDCCWVWDIDAATVQHVWSGSFRGRYRAFTTSGMPVGMLAWSPGLDRLVCVSELLPEGAGKIWCGQLGAAVVLEHSTELLLFTLSQGHSQLARRVALGPYLRMHVEGSGFSPDGSHWAAVVKPNDRKSGANTELLIVSFAGGGITRLTLDISQPKLHWGPSGSSILAEAFGCLQSVMIGVDTLIPHAQFDFG